MKNRIFFLVLFNICFCFGLKNNRVYRKEIETQFHKFVCPLSSASPVPKDCPSPLIGTLIHPQWCITAAHFAPRVGTLLFVDNLRENNNSCEMYSVVNIIYHPKYSPHRDLRYDLALVKINRPILIYPVIERERDDSLCSLQNWVISLKYRVKKDSLGNTREKDVITTGVVELYCPKKEDSKYFSHHFYTCFYTSRFDFNRGEYTFDRNINKKIAGFRLKPKLELSRFKVHIENGDSGSPVLNCPPGHLTVPRMTLRLNGIVISYLKPANDDVEEGHMGIILRLPHTGLNEFIDHEILKDALK